MWLVGCNSLPLDHSWNSSWILARVVPPVAILQSKVLEKIHIVETRVFIIIEGWKTHSRFQMTVVSPKT